MIDWWISWNLEIFIVQHGEDITMGRHTCYNDTTSAVWGGASCLIFQEQLQLTSWILTTEVIFHKSHQGADTWNKTHRELQSGSACSRGIKATKESGLQGPLIDYFRNLLTIPLQRQKELWQLQQRDIWTRHPSEWDTRVRIFRQCIMNQPHGMH